MATIHDVAEQAKVSTATVSRTLNHRFGVGSETRERVLAAVFDLNYKPYAAARNLRLARDIEVRELTHAVGLLVKREVAIDGDPFARELTTAIQRALCERGLGIHLIPASPEGDLPSEIRDGGVDGLIGRFDGPLLREIAQALPTVNLDLHEKEAEMYSLVPDYAQGVYEMTRRLLAAGHRRLALLTTAPRENDQTFWTVFPTGCMRALDEAGVPVCADLFQGQAGTARQGYEIGRRLFADKAAWPDAVMGPDAAMLGVYRAAAECGVGIPEDVSMMGINNLTTSEYLVPALTSLDIGLNELAARGVSVLTECIESGKKRKGFELTPVELCVRESARI